MLTDTHCHINMMVKKEFDIPLTQAQLADAQAIIEQAAQSDVTTIINVGTSLVESENCIWLAQKYPHLYATVGIHPNDCTVHWQQELKKIALWCKNKEKNKIVGIGEIGLDRHYKEYNLERQIDAFKAQIELALEHNLAIVVHSREAYDETLKVIEPYLSDITRAVMHCFSYDLAFAQGVTEHRFKLGMGGTLTYPKNSELRTVAQTIGLEHMVLETDAPFLPIQSMRGKMNHPAYIKNIAEYLAELKSESLEEVARVTTENAKKLFGIE